MASLRGVSRPVAKLPPGNQPPSVMLSKELVSPADVRFVSLYTVEPSNNGHFRDERFVHCSEVIPSSEVECMGNI